MDENSKEVKNNCYMVLTSDCKAIILITTKICPRPKKVGFCLFVFHLDQTISVLLRKSVQFVELFCCFASVLTAGGEGQSTGSLSMEPHFFVVC